jgi:hypothetical protein
MANDSGTTIRHETQMTQNTQNKIPIQRNTDHKTTQTTRDTLHKMNTILTNYMELNTNRVTTRC